MGSEITMNKPYEEDDFNPLVDEISNDIDNKHQIISGNDGKNRFLRPDVVTLIPSIHQLFSYHVNIGRGVSGGVFLARSKQTCRLYALKQMLRSDKHNALSFMNEMKILNECDHPNIVRLHGAIISNQHYYLLTEYCAGGTLLDKMFVTNRCSEQKAVAIMLRILNTINYIHSKNIVHRDIKMENIVFDRHSNPKLIDFGQSEKITDGEKKDRHLTGSLFYLPPESIRSRKKYQLYAGDMWAIGVLVYKLVHGYYPFPGNSLKSVMKRATKDSLKWDKNIPVSEECKDFIESLLQKDPSMRLTAEQALKHKWIVNTIGGDAKSVTVDECFQTNAKKESEGTLTHIDIIDINIDIESILAEIDVENKVQRAAHVN